MKKNILMTFLTAGILSLITFGCMTPQNLDPNGVYKQDAFLYDQDETIIQSYNFIDSFLVFETQNNSYIKTNYPSIFNAANEIRDKFRLVRASVSVARNEYLAIKGNTDISQTSFIEVSNKYINSVSFLLGEVNQLKSSINGNSSISNGVNTVLATNSVTSINQVLK